MGTKVILRIFKNILSNLFYHKVIHIIVLQKLSFKFHFAKTFIKFLKFLSQLYPFENLTQVDMKPPLHISPLCKAPLSSSTCLIPSSRRQISSEDRTFWESTVLLRQAWRRWDMTKRDLGKDSEPALEICILCFCQGTKNARIVYSK